MNYITQKTERNRRFTRACREEMARARLSGITEEVVQRVLNAPVDKGFFISVDHLIVMDRRRREGKLPAMGSDTRMMWDEIFHTFDAWLDSHPDGTRTDAAIHTVARGRASRFFISPANARRILDSQNITCQQHHSHN